MLSMIRKTLARSQRVSRVSSRFKYQLKKMNNGIVRIIEWKPIPEIHSTVRQEDLILPEGYYWDKNQITNKKNSNPRDYETYKFIYMNH